MHSGLPAKSQLRGALYGASQEQQSTGDCPNKEKEDDLRI